MESAVRNLLLSYIHTVSHLHWSASLKVDDNWLMVSTRLKNISQIGNLPQIGVKNGENKKYLKPPPR